MDLAHIGHGLFRAAHIRLGDDFQQRRTGAVEINAGHAGVVFMQRLAGVFFKMGAGHADALGLAVFQLDIDMAGADDGQVELRDLVALGQVGIEIVFTREHTAVRHLGVDGHAEFYRHMHGLFIQDRQHPRQRDIDHAGLGIGLGAVGGAGAGEDLGFCG